MKQGIIVPHSWSELSWRQLCDCWKAKLRYGGNADVARAAALLALCNCYVCRNTIATDKTTGESIYTLSTSDGELMTTTPRSLAHMARKALPWFDWPYGDPGEKEERDEKGKVTKERREPVAGYVSQMRDAMVLPETELTVASVTFALPQVACNNLTWQQYRTLQALAPQIFTEGMTDEQTLDVQAQFLAHMMVPSNDGKTTADQFRPRHVFRYDAERAEQTVLFWRHQLSSAPHLFHIGFQCYQTAILYYEKVYPLLFSESGKNDSLRDALTGEVGTINTVMKYAGYAEQQQVYDSNLPFVLDILNTMTKEAKEIEKMNAKIKKH